MAGDLILKITQARAAKVPDGEIANYIAENFGLSDQITQARQKNIPDAEILNYLAQQKVEQAAPTELTSEEKFAAKNPNLYGAYGAGRALLRTGIEAGGTALGAAGGALIPAPGTSLLGAGGGYAVGKRVADVALGEPTDMSAGGIAKDVAMGGIMQGAGNIIGKGIMKAMPQSVVDKLYASANKIPTSTPLPERQAFINTGLREGAVPNMESGVVGKWLGFKGYNDVVAKLNSIDDSVEQIINASSNNGVVSARAVASRLDSLLAKGDRISKVDPNFKATIQKVKNELLTGPDDIPVAQAQEMKRHIYKVYKEYYGIDDATAALVQGKKAIARGFKEEIEVLHPEVKNLNMSEGELVQFLDPYGRAIGRIQNRDIIGLGMQIAPMTASAATGGSSLAAKTGLVAKLIDTPSVKARLAILLHKARTSGTGGIRQTVGAVTPLSIIAGKNEGYLGE